MPISRAAQGLKEVRKTIRKHWTQQEKLRRREMAELMQQRLLAVLRGRAVVG